MCLFCLCVSYGLVCLLLYCLLLLFAVCCLRWGCYVGFVVVDFTFYLLILEALFALSLYCVLLSLFFIVIVCVGLAFVFVCLFWLF